MTSRPAQTMCLAAAAVALGASLAARTAAIQQAAPSPQERVAALKQSMQESQTKLRQYEWVETTIISLKGEEKARTQKRCYYGADGKLQKVPIGGPAPAQESPAGGGRRGRVKAKVVENKKDEMSDYMEKAVALIHQYVPPNAEKIQAAKDGGKMKVLPPQAGKVRVEFKDFVLPGDLMNIDVDAKALLLAGVNIATYLEKKDDAVTLDVIFGKLTDGTGYNAKTTLAAKAKNITVVIENSGHRPLGK